MAIQKVENPVTGETMNMVKGEVQGVYFNEPHEKIKSNPKMDWAKVAVKVKIDGEYIQLGFAEEKKLRCKDPQGNYHDVARGMKAAVVVNVSKNGQYTNLDAQPKNITINDATAAPAQQSTGGSKGGGKTFKKDDTGMRAGHSINGAFNLTRGKMSNVEEFLEIAKHVDAVTESAKTKYAEKTGLKRDSYDLGACVGNAVLNACKLVTVAKKDTLEEKTLGFLDAVAEPLLAHIRGEDKKEEVEPEGTCTPDVVSESINDSFTDDIPF